VAASKQQGDPVADAVAAINKKYGPGSVFEMGSFTPPKLDVISTGSLGLDAATAVGGLPRGRIIEIFGPFSSGKTTIALHAAADAQRQGLRVAMVDAEHALDPDYAKALGVDVDHMFLNQPSSGEEGLDVVEMLTTSEGFGLIIIDSVAALVPQAEIDGEMGKAQIGLQARLMSQALRKLAAKLNDTKTTAIFVNQLREKVGFVLGNPETQPGGRALAFYSTMRLDARPIKTLKQGTEAIGRRTRVKVVKNKVGTPFRQAEFDILFGLGINRPGEILDWGLATGVLRTSGSHWFADQQPLGSSKETARMTLASEPELARSLEAQIRAVGLTGLLGSSSASSGDEAPEPPELPGPVVIGNRALIAGSQAGPDT
jgi:recombination protein RecA